MDSTTKAMMMQENSPEKCDFCNTTLCDVVNLGEKFQLKDLVVHYYCVVSCIMAPFPSRFLSKR